jgi:hypothetical protein
MLPMMMRAAGPAGRAAGRIVGAQVIALPPYGRGGRASTLQTVALQWKANRCNVTA